MHSHRIQRDRPQPLGDEVPKVLGRHIVKTQCIHAVCPCGHGGATPHPRRLRLGQAPIRRIGVVHGLPPQTSGAPDARLAHEQGAVVSGQKLRSQPVRGLRRDVRAEDAACKRRI